MADAFGLAVVTARRVEAQRAWKIPPIGVGPIERRGAKDGSVSDAVNSGIDATIGSGNRIVKVFAHFDFRILGEHKQRTARTDPRYCAKNITPHPSDLAKSKGTFRFHDWNPWLKLIEKRLSQPFTMNCEPAS